MLFEEHQDDLFVTRSQLCRYGCGQAIGENTGTAAIETHPEYPLECVCVHLYEPFQLKFARHAEQLLNVTCELDLEAGHHGLTMRGETESELEFAATILRDFYGSQIQLGPMTVRYHRGATLEEPFMGVRVRCQTDRIEAVKSDFIRRGGLIVSSEVMRGLAFVRAVAPLRSLIGYAAALTHLAGSDARQVMWLSYYAPCTNGAEGEGLNG